MDTVGTMAGHIHPEDVFISYRTERSSGVYQIVFCQIQGAIVIAYGIRSVDFIKNPMLLEFLSLPPEVKLRETKLESALISHLKDVLMELGRGFCFVARQKHMRTESDDFFIDLVFYNSILKCYFLIDLKVGRVTHQDVGQMDMYRRMYDELVKQPDDNPTVGIVLCSETDQAIARYSILKGNEKLFAVKYKTYLPDEETLRREIEAQKELYRLQLQDMVELNAETTPACSAHKVKKIRKVK